MNWLFELSDWQTPGLELQLRLRSEVVIEDLPTLGLNVTHFWGTLRLAGVTPAVTTTLKRLASGWVARSELWTMAVEGDPTNVGQIAAFLSEHIWAFDQLGFLFRLRLVWHERPLMTVEPLSYASRLMFGTDPPGNPRLSQFAFLQPHPDGLVMESAVAAHRVVLHDEWGASLISVLARGELGVAASTFGDEVALAAIGLLDAAGMLEGHEHVSATGVGYQLLRMGEFHDLLFHRRSRFGWHDGSFGAVFPYLDELPPGPALATPLADTIIPLPTPDEDDVRARDLTLTQALERRASGRQYSTEPLTMLQLGEFLFRCARVRAVYGPAPEAGMPYEASDRPYPSGGGIHDLELYLIVSHVQDLPAGVYHYAADRHALEMLPAGEEAVALLLQTATRASAALEPPHVLIQIASRFGRMSWKYRSISYATTLKNVGVLYQTMYLVATAMGLAACALGSGNNVASEQALNLATRSEIAVGEFMLGNPPAKPAAVRNAQVGHVDPTWRPLIKPNWGRD